MESHQYDLLTCTTNLQYLSKRTCLVRSQCFLTPFHDSPASFSTSRPQMTYLFEKCSIQPFMFSLLRKGGSTFARGEKGTLVLTSLRETDPRACQVVGLSALTSLCSRNGVSIRGCSKRERRTNIKRLFCHTPRRVPPRKIPVHPILKGSSVTFALRRLKSQRVFTWAVETPASRDVEHGTGDGKQDPSAVKSTELCECAWGIRREEYRRCVSAGHP
jgi:hypothetical protein